MSLSETEPLADGVDDPPVGLVGDKVVEVGNGKPVGAQRRMGGVFHGPHRQLENLVPLHLDEDLPTVQELLRRRIAVSRTRLVEQFPVAAVAIDVRGEDAGGALFSGQHDSAGAIAEEAAGIPVGPVHDTGKDLHPDDEDVGGSCRF